MAPIKNRERDVAPALAGRLLAKKYINQPIVGADVRWCVGEEVSLGRNVWGGWLLIVLGGKLIDDNN